ncbi:MAG: hypothetical protein JWN67_302 [Actinomycetia bacterium]|nr:hypothetical protein [Actinomycetes bacterium]
MLPTTLSSTEDAIALAEVALGPDRLVALVDGPAKLALPIAGDVPPEGVERIDGILLMAIGDEPGNRLVLATRRPGPPAVTEDELACWRMMLARHAGRGLALFDWLVFVDGGGVLSLADEAGPAPAWAA